MRPLGPRPGHFWVNSASGRVGQRNPILPERGVHLWEGPVNMDTTGVGCRVHKCMGPAAPKTTC